MDYSLEVQQRFRSPEGAGEFAEGTPGIAAGEAEDRTLNVWVCVQIEVAGSVIRSVRFRVFGCPHIVAATGWAAETLQGRGSDSLRELDMHELRARLDAPLEKLGKLLVLENALQACWRALNDPARSQNGS